jgi:hypothetical protein
MTTKNKKALDQEEEALKANKIALAWSCLKLKSPVV